MNQFDDAIEAQRVVDLARYEVLDSEPEPAFDRVTKLASEFFDAPVSAISFPFEDRLWFKSTVGLDIPECPRAAGICSHVIENNAPLVLHDALDNTRFQDHPMVACSPHVRFYAGAPLITPAGQRIGSLCVADVKPRLGFSEAEAQRLQELALLVIDGLELRLERKNAQRASEAKSAFLAAMSHEIRTPMNGVLGMAELLLTADDIGDRHRRRIEIIQRSGETLLTLLDQILDLSKIETDKLELNVTPFNLRELTHDIHGLFEPKALSKTLWFDVNDRIGAHHRLIGDPLRLRQILSNFVGNAVKFTAEGGITLLVNAQPLSTEKVRVRFEVKDTGIGIAPEAGDRVFFPFEQADSLMWSKFGGTGLGLAICKKLATMMHGKVGAESLSGEGSIFWLEVDLETQVEHQAPAETPQTVTTAAGYDKEPSVRDILVAEDDDDMALLIEDLLEEAGYKATIAPDGASVLRILSERRFDVVLMDGRMPDMSGFETTDRIRQLPDERSHIPIIALTAEALAGDRERFLSAGMDGYVSKPIDYSTLVETIERCCRQKPCSSTENVEEIAMRQVFNTNV